MLSVSERRISPFTDGDIDLLSMFAEQAALTNHHQSTRGNGGEPESGTGALPPRTGRRSHLLSPRVWSFLEGHRSEITVMFANIRGFTEFAATAEPKEVITGLGTYPPGNGDHLW